eukprot:m.182601 g.182601  ORF g.182601 m.182601 type:complete len:482 (-) comp16643_c0_seq4:786-2231(-)
MRISSLCTLWGTIIVFAALASTRCFAAPVASPDDTDRLTLDNLHLAAAAFDEIEQLSDDVKEDVLAKLSTTRLTMADAASLHVSQDGEFYFEDVFTFPDTLPDDHLEEAHNRGRRMISDKPPSRYDKNGLPIFHSRPGSKNVLFLDFDGHENYGGHWGRVSAKPYDPSGNGVKFTRYEQGQIALIWARVSEDYAPFNIDVTTEDFGKATSRTMHCVITESKARNGAKMPAGGAGGLAVLDVFGKSTLPKFSPAWVYYDNLMNGLNDYVAEAASHEIGHNLGLSHDNYANKQFAAKHKGTTKENSWGPIMTNSYNMAETQWSDGSYPGGTNHEDDIGIIRRKLGLVGDETGQTRRSARNVKYVAAKNYKVEGVISRRDDKDWWRIKLRRRGSITANAKPWYADSRTPGNNLDIKLTLRNAAGKALKISSPSGTAKANLKATGLKAGTYYIEVDGVGDPRVFGSDYGSLGQYRVTGYVSAPAK